jgi:hypothetical protein
MLNQPFFSELEAAKCILIAGAGGGYDVFGGLPLYFALTASGKEVHLANLSFTFLSPVRGQRLTPAMVTVNADTERHAWYFPEQYLCEWFREREGREVEIHCFERTGVKPLLASYRALVEALAVDTVLLVDGGTDSLMRGDEDGLGTPHEDVASIAAVSELAVERKLLACLGFGVDRYHGVSNALTFEAIADLTHRKGLLGVFSLLEDMPEAKKYREAAEFVFERMPHSMSIVSSSILSALAGHYGDHHTTSRTKGSTLWINPLMAMYWCFRLEAVAERILYLEPMKETQSYADVDQVITSFRRTCQAQIRQRHTIPD